MTSDQRLVIGGDVPSNWWEGFHVSSLNVMVERALKENASIGAMTAALRRSAELEQAQRASLLPTVSADVTVSRGNVASTGSNRLVSAGTSQLAYTPDFWGGLHRGVEAAKAQTDYQRFQLEAARLALSSAVVRYAIAAASLARQIRAADQISSAAIEQLRIIQRRFDLGAVTADEVALQELQVTQTKAAAQSLRLELAITRNQLASYLGRPPEQADLPEIDFDSIALPETLPLSLPSTLIDRRPDIRAAEANWHAQTAELGVATALRLPSLTLGGTLGVQGGSGKVLFGPGSAVWSLLVEVTQAIFDGGALRHRQRAQREAVAQAAELWRDQVVVAFQGVADVLARIGSDTIALNLAIESEHAANRSLSIASARYRSGAAPFLLLLTAQRSQADAVAQLIRAREARLTDCALLYEALGGGWWHDRVDARSSTETIR
ncbi:NodT family efflux transporter outer membrane factor (OMF) lipoprotein [Sphingomonas sp. 1185]